MKFFEIEEEIFNEFMRDEGVIEDDDDDLVVLLINVVLVKIWFWFEYFKCLKVVKVVVIFFVIFIVILIYVLCVEIIYYDKIFIDFKIS